MSRCPGCDFENVAGAELCESCGHDMLDAGVPHSRGGMQGRIFSDPLSALEPAVPPVVPSTATVAEAIRLMREKHHGSVLVVDGGRLSGLFTERDVVLRLAGRDLRPEQTPVGAVMTVDPVTLREDSPLAHAIHLMAVRGVRHIPVLRGEVPIGVVSIRGVLRYLTEQALQT